MAQPNWYLGRTSRYFVAAGGNGLSTYGTAGVFSATSAMRIAKAMLSFDPHKYTPSPQRFTHPSQVSELLRRYEAKFQVDALWYPSGTLNTVPESDTWLQNVLGGGAATNITLATTFSGSPTTTTGTVASATGLTANQFVQIHVASNSTTYTRFLTNVAGATLTWSPALPVAPVASDTLAGGVTYSLATALPHDLDMASYPHAPASSTPARELLGCVPDKLLIGLDSNSEPTIQLSGPAQMYAGSSPNWTPQSEPGTWTTVGAEASIPSGLTSTFTYNGTVYQITKLEFTIENNMAQQNNASGTQFATAMYRNKKRVVTLKATAMVSDDKTLWTPSLTASQTAVPVLLQIGNVSGYIWGIYLPLALITTPATIPDTDESQSWDFMLTALGNAGNDEIYLGQV